MSTYQEYAKWGWPCFPISGPAYAKDKEDYKTWKAPLVNWTPYQTRLPNPDEISLWEKKWPLAWIGCTTGPFSNLFVIDIDGEDGVKSLAELAIPLPITKIAKTQRGHHYFFKWNARLAGYVTTKSKVRPGIDVRGRGGLVVLPSPQSKRSWVCEEFCAELPEPWYSVLEKDQALPKNWQAKTIAELSLGNRHDTFVSLISSCFNAKWPVESIMAVLRPFAVECKLDEDLEKLILDIQGRYFSTEGRLSIMQENTRKAVDSMPLITPDKLDTLKKTHPDLIASAFKAQDNYDREAIRWLSMDKSWEGSDADRALSEWGKCVCNLSTSL
jgi:hypothetical protein